MKHFYCSKTAVARNVTLIIALFTLHSARPADSLAPAPSKLPPAVTEGIASGKTTAVTILLEEQADLSPARDLPTRAEKGRFVFETLRATAARTQPALCQELDRLGLKHREFWIANTVLVEVNRGLSSHAMNQCLGELAARADVKSIEACSSGVRALHDVPGEIFHPRTNVTDCNLVDVPLGWNVEWVGAPKLWRKGITGQGIVIASIDTGVQWDHPALKASYRGWNAAAQTVDHNYNWWDGLRDASGTNVCGYALTEPCDDQGHGTHTMGTAVGSAPGAPIGVAPGARWISCRGHDNGIAVPGALESCLQFLLAPTDVHGNNPRPEMAPDILFHSYGVPQTETLLRAYEALEAFGIINVASAGNFGICSGILNAPGIFRNVITVAAQRFRNDGVAPFSSRGPGIPFFTSQKPEVAAPGECVASAARGGGYSVLNGTSMSAPAVAGCLALLWGARIEFKYDIFLTRKWLIRDLGSYGLVGGGTHAITNFFEVACNSPAPGDPNYFYGYGKMDVAAGLEPLLLKITPGQSDLLLSYWIAAKAPYTLEYTTNFPASAWFPLTNARFNGRLEYRDVAPTNSSRFYRVRTE